MKFNCRKCGLCCKSYPIDVTYSDIVRWNEEGRKDILKEVSFLNNYPETGYGGFYIEKSVRSPKQPCPFLEDNSCSIYETRPLICKDFPYSKKTDCACPEYDLESISRLKRHLINADQMRDLKKTKTNFDALMAILMAARK